MYLFTLTFPALSQERFLFDDTSMFKITVKFSFLSVFSDRGINPQYHKAELSYVNEWGGRVNLPIEIKTRGIFRKNPENCSQPSLLIRFRIKDVKYTPFEEIDELKLVIPCQQSKPYQELVLKEFLAYRLYTLVSPVSYRVKLLSLTLKDQETDKTRDMYAFFIEPTDILARRLGALPIDKKNIHPNACNREATTTMSVFQYMIGHTDWSIKALHNITLLEMATFAPPIPVPFDFDFSGFVDAPYALPAEHLPISSVKERHYNGYCRTDQEFNEVFGYFISKKDTIEKTIETFYYLPEKQRSDLRKYIDDFFDTIQSETKRKSKIVSKCRTD